MSDSDIAIVKRARDGDGEAFEELVRRTSRLVFARLYLETGNAHRAEDLLQEAFLLAFRSLHRLSDPAEFRSWLLAIAHRVLIDAVRREARLKRSPPPRSETPLSSIPSSQLPPDQEAAREELRQQVLAALRSLPKDYRLPLTLRYIVGADAAAIGTQLGLTNGALRGLLHRGMRMLRERIPAELCPDFVDGK